VSFKFSSRYFFLFLLISINYIKTTSNRDGQFLSCRIFLLFHSTRLSYIGIALLAITLGQSLLPTSRFSNCYLAHLNLVTLLYLLSNLRVPSSYFSMLCRVIKHYVLFMMLKYEFLLIWKYTSIIAKENFIIFFLKESSFDTEWERNKGKTKVFFTW